MKTLALSKTLLCLALTGQVFGAKVIPNHDIADLVLGQPDFTTSSITAPITSFKSVFPAAVLVDPVSRKVFVGESTGNRILRYPSVAALSNGAPAEAVFGQASFSTIAGSAVATGLASPSGL